MRRSLRAHPFLLSLVAVTTACGPGDTPPPDGSLAGTEDGSGEMVKVAPSPAAARLATLPSSSLPGELLTGVTAWQGELPCADCAGIHTTLVLDPDGGFRMDEAYLGLPPERIAQGDTLFGTRGRWTASPHGTRLRLDGEDQGPRHLRLTAEGALRLLDREGGEIGSNLDYELVQLPAVPELRGGLAFRGAFSYMADAALVVTCASGLQFPVAMEGEYLELERSYGLQAPAPGAPWRVHLRGEVADRPAMEGTGTEEAFVVASFEVAPADAPCPALEAGNALAEGEWEVTELDGAPLPELPAPASPPTLAWDRGESRVGGTGGCNRYAGRGFLRGTALFAQEVAATRRFCQGVMEVEDRFFRILTEGGHLRLDGADLVLFRGPVQVARFRRL
jgi:copper homeostasis protein (lipoprotein)